MAQLANVTQTERFKVKDGEDPRDAAATALRSVLDALPTPDASRSRPATITASCQVAVQGSGWMEFEAVASLSY